MIRQKWESHKTVEAFQITSTSPTIVDDDGNYRIELLGMDGQAEIVNKAWLAKHLPEGALHHSTLVGGYFVRYQDGYTSWSPREAFESGYTELTPTA